MVVFKLINIRRFATAMAVVAVVATCALLGLPVPSASADPCPDVEVVFARGSGEPPGIGSVGGPFTDALRGEIGGRSLGVYPVNYQASTDFGNPDFPKTVVDGIRDASAHIESMAANCPKTREVLLRAVRRAPPEAFDVATFVFWAGAGACASPGADLPSRT